MREEAALDKPPGLLAWKGYRQNGRISLHIFIGTLLECWRAIVGNQAAGERRTVAHTPLKLLPDIAKAAPVRATQLHLPFSSYVALLIHNHERHPVRLRALPAAPDLVRVHVPCSWRAGLRPLASRLAKDAGLSVNAFVETLIANELLSPERDFTIRAGSAKPSIQLKP